MKILLNNMGCTWLTRLMLHGDVYSHRRYLCINTILQTMSVLPRSSTPDGQSNDINDDDTCPGREFIKVQYILRKSTRCELSKRWDKVRQGDGSFSRIVREGIRKIPRLGGVSVVLQLPSMALVSKVDLRIVRRTSSAVAQIQSPPVVVEASSSS